MTHNGVPTLTGFDINATRMRAVSGTPGTSPHTLPLDGAQAELPLALSLEGRAPVIGRAALALCRQLPHLACLDFLGYLGENREWRAGRHVLDASKALALVFERLRPLCASTTGLVFALPAYLSRPQIGLLAVLAEKAKLPVLGTVSAPLATTLAAYAEQPWTGLAAVVDVDEHALTWSVVLPADSQARILCTQSYPQLSLRAWKERLLNVTAERCVRQSRRDPRDSAPAEQMLYEQLDNALDACRQGQMAELVVQTAQWCQNLVLRPDEVAGYCAPLLRQTVTGMQTVLATAEFHHSPSALLVTPAAAHLPGLLAALEERMGRPHLEVEEDSSTDFGEFLLEDDPAESVGLCVLSADSVARAAHALACDFQRGDLPHGHLDVAPLPAPQPVDAGPARLHFRGQDYVLRCPAFTLGRHSGCNLVLDGDQYPSVSTRHCEIVCERRGYVLRDRSRSGTLVNDRPVIQQITLQAGDWIRLGTGGPLLRFLGQAADQRKLMTTA